MALSSIVMIPVIAVIRFCLASGSLSEVSKPGSTVPDFNMRTISIEQLKRTSVECNDGCSILAERVSAL